VIIPLLQSTHDDDRNGAIAVLDEDRYTTPVDRIVLCRLTKAHLGLERLLIAIELVLKTPSASIEANDGSAFPGNPEVVV